MSRPVDPRNPIPWDRVLRILCKRYGWAPETVWELTMPEVQMYLVDDEVEDRNRTSRGGNASATLPGVMEKLNASRAKRGLPPITEIRTLGPHSAPAK